MPRSLPPAGASTRAARRSALDLFPTLAPVSVLLVGLSLASSMAHAEPALVAETEALSPQEQQKLFHLPPGFEIELIAAEPVCRKPMNLKFDAAGRLYFTQSIEYPWPAPDDRPARDTLQVMIDTNGDHVPDTAQAYAEGLNIPIGLTPIPGGVLGHSIPTLYFFPDADGDLRADGRTEFYRSFGFRDTHGMCSSLNYWVDGWVYGCHGFSNDSDLAGEDGKPIHLQSGNTYRLRPDGSHIEQFTRGQVNPFGMCFDEFGDVYTSDCHTKPAYLLLRGGCYPSFGKPHDGLGFAPELMQHLHGSTGIAGVVYYAAQQFPAEFRDNLFIGNPVTGRINRDTLAWTGSTAKAIEQPDFLWCDDPWFRPVDIQMGPDGSLYVADFYNCIIGHYEVPLNHPRRDRDKGRIWRIRYTGGTQNDVVGNPVASLADQVPVTTTPDRATAAELFYLLDHPQLLRRVEATHQLVHRIGRQAAERQLTVGVTEGTFTARQMAHLVWVALRWGQLDGAADKVSLWNRWLTHSDPLVRTHAARALGEVSGDLDPAVAALLLTALEDTHPRVRRAAVEALAKRPNADAGPALLRLWAKTDPADELLVHSLRISLREQANQFHLLTSLTQARELSEADASHLAQVALGMPTAEASSFLARYFQSNAPGWLRDRAAEFLYHVVRYLPAEQVDESLSRFDQVASQLSLTDQAQWLRTIETALRERGATRSIDLTQWGLKTASALLEHSDRQALQVGLDLARELRLSDSTDHVRKLALAEDRDAGLRCAAIDSLAAFNGEALVHIAPDLLTIAQPAEVQQHVTQVLGSLNRADAQTLLLAAFRSAPEQLALGLARGLALSHDGGEALLAAVAQGNASPRLLQDQTVQQRLQAARIDKLDERLAELMDGLPVEDERISALLQQRLAGFSAATTDKSRGQMVFAKNCGNCHRLGGTGNKVGPELDGVGLRGLARLLEDTLNPSRNVDQAFRTTVVALHDGRVVTGLALREEGEVLLLVDEQGREVRVATSDIEDRRLVKLSPMPANVAERLPEAEFYDLIAYLLDQRTQKPKEE